LLPSPGCPGILYEQRQEKWSGMREKTFGLTTSGVQMILSWAGETNGHFNIIGLYDPTPSSWNPKIPVLLARGIIAIPQKEG